ncbi:MAG TPA: menaquinone biosynthesis protein [Planctomycetaceae bacterium]|nr:menaquinone biosynthesis protein [Planctomycetaceae bacterium]
MQDLRRQSELWTPDAADLVRIGAVSYLNSKPLVEGLDELAPRAEVMLDYPSRLADHLADGLLDVALVPSFECLRAPGYEVVSDACVATNGPVMSVKLYSRVPPGEIRRLALDEGSRTSAALARVMLAERYGVWPQTEPLPLGSAPEAAAADAVLVIGDRAIRPPRERFAVTWDLGQEWLDWTGLPFVFALWASRSGTDLGDVEDALAQARDRGVAALDGIAEREAPRVGIPVETARHYLTRNLHFSLGEAERSGLALFQELTVTLGLAPGGIELVYRDCAASGTLV